MAKKPARRKAVKATMKVGHGKAVEAQSRERVKGEVVAATYTRQFLKRFGTTESSRLIGMSTTTFHKARNSGLVSKNIEVVCYSILRLIELEPKELNAIKAIRPDMGPGVASGQRKEPTSLVTMEVTPEMREMLEQMANKAGIPFRGT